MRLHKGRRQRKNRNCEVIQILHLVIDWNRSRCGQISAGIQHLSFVLLAICGVPEFGYHIENSTYEVIISHFITNKHRYFSNPFPSSPSTWPSGLLSFFRLPSIAGQTCEFLKRFSLSKYEGDKRELQRNSKELDSSFLNRLTIWWFTSVQITGARKDLEVGLFLFRKHNTRKKINCN